MDMENIHFDELHYSLPDYITGELDDEKIKEQIEAKLLVDSSFREEYDSLKATMNFLQEAELEPPSEVYFANLQANILSKVHKDTPAEQHGILAKLVGYWKVLIPALTVCVVLVIYTRNMETPQLPLSQDIKVQIPFNDKGKNTQDTSSKDEDISTENSTQTENVSNNDVISTTPKHKKNELVSPQQIISSNEGASLTDDSEGSIIFGKDDESQAQDEYDQLSTDDQLDILQSLKDKKL